MNIHSLYHILIHSNEYEYEYWTLLMNVYLYIYIRVSANLRRTFVPPFHCNCLIIVLFYIDIWDSIVTINSLLKVLFIYFSSPSFPTRSSSVLPSESVNNYNIPFASESAPSSHIFKRRKLRATIIWDYFRSTIDKESREDKDGRLLYYYKQCKNSSSAHSISSNARYHLTNIYYIIV